MTDVDPRQFGVLTDGKDHTAALQRAVAHTQAVGGRLPLAPGVYGYSDLLGTITDRMSIVGAGGTTKRTVLVPMGGYDGPAFVVDDCWYAGHEVQSATDGGWRDSKAGVELSGFAIIGDRTVPSEGIRFVGRNDHVRGRDLYLGYLAGGALTIGTTDPMGLMRESRFTDVVVRGCGSPTVPAVDIGQGADVGDDTNQLTFTDMDVVQPYGVGIRVTGRETSGYSRRITFRNLMLHGHHSHPDAPDAHLMEVHHRVADLNLDGLKANGSHPGRAAVLLTGASNANGPVNVRIAGDIRECAGDGIAVQRGGQHLFDLTTQPGQIAGDAVRFEVNSTTRARLDVLGAGPTSGVVLDPTVEGLVSGVWDDTWHAPA